MGNDPVYLMYMWHAVIIETSVAAIAVFLSLAHTTSKRASVHARALGLSITKGRIYTQFFSTHAAGEGWSGYIYIQVINDMQTKGRIHSLEQAVAADGVC